ncbi:MAG: hypothetical protein HFP81_02180 [Methylococcales symbiont of Hymedesmia sp. n. MRB-2018]|nr:MAG: hypothetical protein HFP78_01860 [Methylococcales symbiont of Hymedesmia sp. n. MRB-2018]KAF3984463.1 MAG: hypothetical protein HFP81_02180 [Methylococcales symbiont of Hymedesmia sp. n. MRB-2018]
MNNTQNHKILNSLLITLTLLLSISINQVNATEKETGNSVKTTAIKKESTKDACLKFVQLKPAERKAYTKCIRHTYDKGRCYKKVNLCLK